MHSNLTTRAKSKIGRKRAPTARANLSSGGHAHRKYAHSHLSYASLFSGCGGFDLGFEAEGFQGVGAFDLDPVAVSTHRMNLKCPVQIGDLKNGVVPTRLQHVGVMLSGSPCQGFSTAGKRRLHDPRNQLITSAGHIAVAMRPRIFVAENVAGVTAGAHSFYWDCLRHMLRWAGYRTIDLRYEATDVGLPQMRRRCIMLAWLGDRVPSMTPPKSVKVGLSDILSQTHGVVDHAPVILERESKEYIIAQHIQQGQKLSNVRAGESAIHTWNIPAVFGSITTREKILLETVLRLRRQQRVREFGDADPVALSILRSHLGNGSDKLVVSLLKKSYLREIDGKVDLKHTFNGLYRRPHWNGHSIAVDTRFGTPRFFLHPLENRGFTVREAARIQGFPDSYMFNGSSEDRFRLIGNAVPPPMSRLLATICRKLLY